MSAVTDQDLARLLSLPTWADQDFSGQGATFAEVYGMAAWLRARLPRRAEGEAVCLASEDRAVIAAALLASLAGGPSLLLPYALSDQALQQMQAATGFRIAIDDQDLAFTESTTLLCPRRGDSGPELGGGPVDGGTELLRLYTGGSTGEPRLWPKTAFNILGEAIFLASHFGVSGGDRILATIVPYHIYGLLYAVALPLVAGATVVAGMPSYPEEIHRAVADSGATILISVPAHYRALRDRPTLGPSLRLAFSSAGALDEADNTAFCRHNPAGIVEVYGSTETGGIALRHRGRGEAHFTPYPSLAWQIDAEQLRVCSPYLSPNLERDAAGFYLTGDRVEACESGFVLRGRADSITKVAGKRVDLEEIAGLIKQQAGVRDCLVLALAEGGGREHRLAAIVAGTVDVEALRRILAARFEPYAHPRLIRVVPQLPLLANGKYDRPAILRLLHQ